MSIASLLSIKVTSPITHMVSSAVRGVAGALLGAWLFSDILSSYVLNFSSILSPTQTSINSGRMSSIAIILMGSIYYTWIKHQESQQAAQSAPGYERVPMEDVESGKLGKNGKPNPD